MVVLAFIYVNIALGIYLKILKQKTHEIILKSFDKSTFIIYRFSPFHEENQHEISQRTIPNCQMKGFVHNDMHNYIGENMMNQKREIICLPYD